MNLDIDCVESPTDTQSLHQGIQKLYILRNLNTFGVDALSVLNQLVPRNIPNLHITQVQTRQTSDTYLPGFSGFTPEMERVRVQHFDEHPIVRQSVAGTQWSLQTFRFYQSERTPLS